jgi:ABC-type polar amino acid transport system ATPase subunit
MGGGPSDGGSIAIDARDIVKTYPGAKEPVLRGATMRVRKGELAVLIGPSGCGKTTLLRCFNGLERFDTGDLVVAGVHVDGMDRAPGHSGAARREIRDLRQKVGFVFQQFNLFPHLDALENICLAPLKVRGRSRAEAVDTAMRLLKKVGLEEKSKSYPEQLSGGQQQRVAIARSLAMEPEVMLYDEPTSALDPSMRDEVLNVMRDLRAEGITQVVVTHEMGFAREGADTVSFTLGGRIHESGTPAEIFGSPRTEEARSFLKKHLDRTGG